jgi:iron complex outermembrane recepter protein
MLLDRDRNLVRTSIRAILGIASCSVVAFGAAAQENAPAQQQGALEEVVVTGFRESLNAALDVKRDAVGAVDAIVAEDIADFPDLNLAESIQRIPGVAIARQGGEGRQISVRGLGPQFTRVRINGMEALSTTGGTDATGGTNRARSFDFNIFASELFNSIRVSKTSSADTEEGSLGATVDLQVARPFDYNGFTMVTGGQLGYNDLQEDMNPRAAALISNTFGDGRFGALLSVAYAERDYGDHGSSAVRWQNSGACPGTPANTNCFAPTSLLPGYSGPSLAALNSAFRPRIPRYDLYQNTQERLGVTGSLQFAPADSTVLTLDALYADLQSTRTEQFLEMPNFSSSMTQVDVLAASINDRNSIVYGLFNDVDVRSEQRYDELETEFTQFTLSGEHSFTDTLHLTALAGQAESKHDNPIQTTLLWDITDADGVSFDFRESSREPVLNYGNAAVGSADAWTLTQIRLRPQTADNKFTNYTADLKWELAERMALKFGAQLKQFEFETTSARRASENASAAQQAVARSSYARLLNLGDTGLDVPGGNTNVFAVPDVRAATGVFNLNDYAGYGVSILNDLGNNFSVNEDDSGAYVQLDFGADLGSLPVRGNIGVRYVETDQETTGWARTAAGTTLLTIDNKYDHTLPALNLVANVTDDFLVRFGAARAITRAALPQLNPGLTLSISGNNKTVNAGNPFLDPTEADNYDLSFEWYFAEESLVGLALFYKDIKTFVQTIRETGQFSDNPFGLPESDALAQCGAAVDPATCLSGWGFNLPTNTPGGELQGVEVSYQQPFSFLPGVWSNFGTILNFTYVDSDVKYLDSNGAVVLETTLAGLSQRSANATLYFDNGVFSARVSAAYRDDYLLTAPGRNGNDVEGVAETLNVDFSTSWAVTDALELTLEALNLTDEFEDQWVDSRGDRLSYYHHTGREYFLGARYKF